MGSNLAAPSLINGVRDVFPAFDDLVQAGEDVESLMAHPGWAHVIRLVEAERSKIDAKLDGGLLESRAHYAHEHGRRSGLRVLEGAAHAIVSVASKELDRQRSKHEGAVDAALEA